MAQPVARDLRVPRLLRVGTDFTGIDMPMLALKELGVPFKYMFACDTSAHCRNLVEACHAPEHMYENIIERETEATPAVDLYCWAAPCQSFSLAGTGRGVQDPRGVLAKFSLRYIAKHRPRLTIMDWVSYRFPLFHIFSGYRFCITLFISVHDCHVFHHQFVSPWPLVTWENCQTLFN